jgi:hypothetical protein
MLDKHVNFKDNDTILFFSIIDVLQTNRYTSCSSPECSVQPRYVVTFKLREAGKEYSNGLELRLCDNHYFLFIDTINSCRSEPLEELPF